MLVCPFSHYAARDRALTSSLADWLTELAERMWALQWSRRVWTEPERPGGTGRPLKLKAGSTPSRCSLREGGWRGRRCRSYGGQRVGARDRLGRRRASVPLRPTAEQAEYQHRPAPQSFHDRSAMSAREVCG